MYLFIYLFIYYHHYYLGSYLVTYSIYDYKYFYLFKLHVVRIIQYYMARNCQLAWSPLYDWFDQLADAH